MGVKLNSSMVCLFLVACVSLPTQNVEARRSTRKPAREEADISESLDLPGQARLTEDRDERDESQDYDRDDTRHDSSDEDYQGDYGNSDDYDGEGDSRSFIGDALGPIGKAIDRATEFVNNNIIKPISPALGGALDVAAGGLSSIGYALNGSSPKDPHQKPMGPPPQLTPIQPGLTQVLPAVGGPAGGSPYVQIIYQGGGPPQVYPAGYAPKQPDECGEKLKLLKLKIKMLESELLGLTRKVLLKGKSARKIKIADLDLDGDDL